MVLSQSAIRSKWWQCKSGRSSPEAGAATPLVQDTSIATQDGSPERAAPTVQMRKGKNQSRCNKPCCIILVIVLLLVFLAAIGVLVALFIVVGNQTPIVKTDCGRIEGDFDIKTGIYIFKGIPFALPPVGPLRWKKTIPMHKGRCWSGVLSAKTYATQCAQLNSRHRMKGSEDCLYLNVFTPSLKPRNLSPVMVYIHGGFLQWGNNSWPGYCPDEAVTEELGVVIVSIQYRLGPFGFLVLDALPGKGNYGFWDQIEALKWVQSNIQQFGGDPEQVTVFGQSSGGTSIFALLAAPAAKGLFHRAWMLSGSPILDKPLEEAAEYNQFFLNKTNCFDENCLRKLNASAVLLATYPGWDVERDALDLPRKDHFEPALAVIDGDLLPKSPFEMWEERNPNISDVPIVIGVTAQELDIAPTPAGIKTMTKEEVTDYIALRLDTFGGDITNQTLALYNYTYEQDAEYIFTTIASDVRVICGNDFMATKATNALGPKVYRYVITSSPSVESQVLNFKSKYAFHCWDLYAFFNTIRYLGIENPSKADLDYGKLLRENILEFVRTGKPKDPNWKPSRESTALISDKLQHVQLYHEAECKFWNDNAFFPYSWIN